MHDRGFSTGNFTSFMIIKFKLGCTTSRKNPYAALQTPTMMKEVDSSLLMLIPVLI